MAALHVMCWQESYAGVMPAEILAKRDFAARLQLWRQLLVDDDAITIAAFSGDSPVGLAVAGKKRAARFGGIDGQLTALYVAGDWQGQGIGRSLLAQAARQWRARLLEIQHGTDRAMADACYVMDDLAKFGNLCQNE